MTARRRPADPTALAPPAPGALARPLDSLLRDPFTQYLFSLHSPRSRASVEAALTLVARELSALDGVPTAKLASIAAKDYRWGAAGALTYSRVNAVIGIIGARHPPMARLALCAIRGVVKAAHNLGLISVDDRLRIADVRPPRLSGSTRGRALADDEIAALFAACRNDPKPKGRRDAAMIASMLGAGLRRFEVSGLDLADYVAPRTAGKTPHFQIRHGKGDKHAIVPAPPDVADAIADWIEVRGSAPGPLFSASGGRRRPLKPGSRLSPAGVYKVLLTRAYEAKLAHTAPHDLRRTMITDILTRTGDLAFAQRRARHASSDTTRKYDKRADDALEKIVLTERTGYK